MLLKLLSDGVLVLENINWIEVGKYLAITCTEAEIASLKLVSVIPKRRVGGDGRGARPGPAFWESDYVDRKVDGKTVKEEK